MTHHSAIRLYTALAALLLAAVPARAQYTPTSLSDPATGETYHIEGAIGYWRPTADMAISSQSLGIPGTLIDFRQDLGLQDTGFPEFHVTLRPATKHKFRFQFIPVKYSQEGVKVPRKIVFNGQAYNIGVPVNWAVDWKAYRFSYEYDFLYTNRWFVGVVLDFKHTDVQASLISPTTSEFTHAQAPIPAIGGIFRAYVVPNISITGEFTGFKLPDNAIKNAAGHYADLDIYGTVNVTNNFGAQVGYRTFDLGYAVSTDAGSFTLKGIYFGGVARF